MERVHASRATATARAAAPLASRPWGEPGLAPPAGHDFARVAVQAPPAAVARPVVQRVYAPGDVDDLATAIRNGDAGHRMRAGLEHLKRFDPADHAGMLADLQANHPVEHATYTGDIGAATHAGATVDPVEAARPHEFARFQELAGWSQMTAAQARTSLSADSGVAEDNLGPTMAGIDWGAGPRAGRHQYNRKGATYSPRTWARTAATAPRSTSRSCTPRWCTRRSWCSSST